MKHLEYYTKVPWPGGISTGSVTEYKVWGYLFYQAHRAKRKQVRRLKAGKTIISTSNFDTKSCAALLSRCLTGRTTEFIEICNRYQVLGYYQLSQYLCACLKLLKKQIDADHSVISMDQIKSERVCMLMKMVQSTRLKMLSQHTK